MRKIITPLLVAFLLLLSGCSEYWWTRGQPPSVATLLSRSQSKLEAARSARAGVREEVAQISTSLEKALLQAVEAVEKDGSKRDLAVSLTSAREAMMDLEGKLSIGSRAAYGELSGQLRRFLQVLAAGGDIEYAPFGLYTARTLSFLANELTVPAPTFG